MVTKVIAQKERNEAWLWLVLLVLLTGAIASQFFLLQYPTAWRYMASFVLLAAGAFVGSRTQKGQIFVKFWQASVLEVRKAVWPTRQETMQTTIAVLAMVVVMGIILWGVDLLLLKAAATLTGRWGN